MRESTHEMKKARETMTKAEATLSRYKEVVEAAREECAVLTNPRGTFRNNSAVVAQGRRILAALAALDKEEEKE
jgi:uncharacterized protein (DUF39 family)